MEIATYTEIELASIQKCINYTFNTTEGRKLFQAALIQKEYEIYEYAGDVVLGFIITCWQMDSAKLDNPGALTNERSSLVSAAACTLYVDHVGLSKLVKIPNMEKKDGLKSVTADMFEAILWAIFVDLDKNISAISRYFMNTYGEVIKRILDHPKINYVSELQIWHLRAFNTLPKYESLDIDITKGQFACTVILGNGLEFTGNIKKKKARAIRSAAKRAHGQICPITRAPSPPRDCVERVNYVGELQNQLRITLRQLPVYKEMAKTGTPDHPLFTYATIFANREFVGEPATTVKAARQSAAKKALAEAFAQV
jgi:dsRNA-specific ribonuclease